MMSLVSAILDMSRLESGQMLLEQKTFNLANLVAETMQAQAALASKKNIRLESAVPAALPPAWGDPALIGRVLQNLIDNACKFTPAGGSVRVMAHAEQRHGRPVLHVSVSDTGPGIPAKIQFQLFRKFVRGQQKERGSGLGLAFCRLAIEAHGERIWVESTSEQGTTMTFSLATAQGT
jgi:signal transduction histidine kinase